MLNENKEVIEPVRKQKATTSTCLYSNSEENRLVTPLISPPKENPP